MRVGRRLRMGAYFCVLKAELILLAPKRNPNNQYLSHISCSVCRESSEIVLKGDK